MLSLRELLNYAYASFSAELGEAKVEEILEACATAAEAGSAEAAPARERPVAQHNREWLRQLRAIGVPVPIPAAEA